jgi:hypothetical protein
MSSTALFKGKKVIGNLSVYASFAARRVDSASEQLADQVTVDLSSDLLDRSSVLEVVSGASTTAITLPSLTDSDGASVKIINNSSNNISINGSIDLLAGQNVELLWVASTWNKIGAISASDLSFDDSGSNITASDSQSAIESLSTELDNIYSVLGVARGSFDLGNSAGTIISANTDVFTAITAIDSDLANYSADMSWVTNGSNKEMVIPSSTHGQGVNPKIEVFETIGTDLEIIELDSIIINASGDITLSIPSILDDITGKVYISKTRI